MKGSIRLCGRMLITVSLTAVVLSGSLSADEPKLSFQRTEEREPCTDYDPLKQPFFGDLHVHTSYSFDSYTSSQRNDPWDAYRYAKGEAITLPDEDGKQVVKAQLQRSVDFTAVTDHAELLGPINSCTEDPWKLGYWWPQCILTRSNIFIMQLLAANGWSGAKGRTEDNKSFVCTLSDCDEGHAEFWKNIQQAAEDHYDRSADCRFTTFVAYEYTDAPDRKNMHRNVIFRNENVTPIAISAYETGPYNFPDLWVKLREQCTDAGTGCEVLAIPHNPNLSGGLMFRDPKTPQEVADRQFFEPLVEITQHKASSECRFDRLRGIGLDTEDELCDFEQLEGDNLGVLGTLHGKVMTKGGRPVPLEEFGRRNMVRNALKDGLAMQQESGQNPFKMGFIGSTDTHSATAGGVEENNFVGHLGRRDAGYRNVQDHFFESSGGHAVIWAEENSRDALFASMQRKEAYATSGTRPIVRFFGSWDYPEDMCKDENMVEKAYAGGKPMGGNMKKPVGRAQTPKFLVSALKDPGISGYPGTDLQRIQIIKGWVGADGEAHEIVHDVAGDPNNGARIDPNTCNPVGRGSKGLCTVWEDKDFNSSQNAFYYARVLENPTCRWSTLHCQAAGVNPFAEDCVAQAQQANEMASERGAKGDVWGKCCLTAKEQPFYSPVIQERAWTSPIWYDSP